MANRSVSNEPQECPGIVGENQLIQTCPFEIKDMARAVVWKVEANLADPFTALNIITEDTWDANLALTTANAPDNIMLTTQVWESSFTAGEPNTAESNIGFGFVTHYEDTAIAFSYKALTPGNENDIMASLRDNSAQALNFIYINTRGQIVTSTDINGEPKPYKVNVASFKDRERTEGRSSVETNMANLRFLENTFINHAVWNPEFDFALK